MARIIYGRNKIPSTTKKRLIKNSLHFKVNLLIILQVSMWILIILKMMGKV